MEKGLKKTELIASLTRSPHGDLKSYVPLTQRAMVEEPEFLAHLIAWNEKNGAIRDSKLALPAITLSRPNFVFVENSLAHLAGLDPRNLVRALRFAKELRTPTHGKQIALLVEGYLRHREATPPYWDRTVIQHRASMKTLYGMFHVKPSERADRILFKGEKPKGSVFEAIAKLGTMSPAEAGAAIANHRIPFLIASGAMGDKLKDTGVALAMINNMSASELVTNSKMLEKLGISTNPVLRAAYQEGLKKVQDSKAGVLKTSVAAAKVSDKKTREKLLGAQEKQIDAGTKIKGSWLVLGDRSPSMAASIEAAKQVAATLARFVDGDVHLVFFDEGARYLNVTGKSLDEIVALTKNLSTGSATSIGVGLEYILEKGIEVDGIAVISDGEENTAPRFHQVYKKYAAKFEKDVPVYFYHMQGGRDSFSGSMAAADIPMTEFDLRGGFDYHSLPNVVQTMRASRFSLVDAIMETPLLTLDDIYKKGSKHEPAIAA